MDDNGSKAPFFRIESLAVLSRQASEPSSDRDWDLTPRSHKARSTTPTSMPTPTATASASASPVVLAVQPLRSRTLVLTVVVVAALVGLTLVFLEGVALKEFDANELTPSDQATLLDDYNSYSGNVASVFSKPVEMFVTLGVQVVVLTFMVDAVVSQPTRSWKAGVVALALASGVGYLVRNGITALNVQLQVREIVPRINAADLTVLANPDAPARTWTLPQSSTVTRTLSELAPQNDAANTILRNLLVEVPARPATQCPRLSNEQGVVTVVEDPSVAFGIPQLDWQRRLLPTALNATKQLRLVVNPSSSAKATPPPTPEDLPMDATVAADLFLYAMIEAPRSLLWGKQLGFNVRPNWTTRFPYKPTTGTDVRSDVGRMADFTGLVPPESDGADETTQRTWFLKEVVAATTRQFNASTNTSKTDIELSFTHLKLSKSLRFDALTIEADFDPRRMTNTTVSADGTRYGNLPLVQSCAQWPALCLFAKQNYTAAPLVDFDPPALVQAFSPCADENGDEKLLYVVNQTASRGIFETLQCKTRATSAIYVLSFAKRLVADALVQNKTASATAVTDSKSSAVATNLRRIYSFTIGRLSWTLDDLGETYQANCTVDTCLGLALPLASAPSAEATDPRSAETQQSSQHVVVGSDALPLDQLSPYETFLYDQVRRTTLARVYEPKQPLPFSIDLQLAGDVLLPHNIGQITWDTSRPASSVTCADRVEDRLRLVVENHLYSEHSLQPAYTAAALFLFQRAVVHDVVSLRGGAQTLNFDGNARPIALWVSIPTQNAWLTLAGCALLVVALVVALVGPSDDPLAAISEPHAIVRVLLNDKQFPPLLLHRQVTDATGSGGMSELDQFQIASLSLEPTAEHKKTSASLEGRRGEATSSRDDSDRRSRGSVVV